MQQCFANIAHTDSDMVTNAIPIAISDTITRADSNLDAHAIANSNSDVIAHTDSDLVTNTISIADVYTRPGSAQSDGRKCRI